MSRTANRGLDPRIQRGLILVSGILLLVAAVAWLANLEQDLPDIRTPRDPGESSVLPGHAVMMPGTNQIHDVDAELSGDWVSQEIGESSWLATDLQGSRLEAAFYGTDLYVLARMGPDATRAYVAVNGEPVDHFSSDDMGSYVGLWAGETTDQPVLLARNLAHGEHTVEIVADGDGELAIAGFDVLATTPFPWAFTLAYIGLGGGLFMLIRSTLYSANRQSRAVIGSRSPNDNATER
jgi:hypothetical protein